MSKIAIKICGMKFEDNLKACLELNPDFIGVICYYKSPRYVENPKILLDTIKQNVVKVAVCVNPTRDEVENYKVQGFDAIQFSGNETVEDLNNFRKVTDLKFIKSLASNELDYVVDFNKQCDFIIIDNKTSGYGGTGQSFDWSILKEVNIPFFLSGGLSPEKTDSIIEFLQDHPNCIGLDLNSGFEIEPGNKDTLKLKEFIERIHGIRS